MINEPGYNPQKCWLELGGGYSDPVEAAIFPQHKLRYRNSAAAASVGLNNLTDDAWIKHFGEFQPLPNSLPQPLALRYHGHQFTHYNPDLGDGRGFLFAQLSENHTQRLLDLGTKGSGQTPYSRRGDGRLTLKGAVREALATAYLTSKGVNTSKTFSIIETGEDLIRNDEPSPTRSAVLVRLSHSHIRLGTFQRLAHFKETDKIKSLINYCLKHHYPNTSFNDFFKAVCHSIAKTTAQWMIHGFVHGVLNTDNINITGESFDYGPYRFLPHYDLNFTAAYFDHQNLYAFGRQPQMIFWNLERLKEALGSVYADEDIFQQGFSTFQNTFEQETYKTFSQKLAIDFESNKTEPIKELFSLIIPYLDESKVPYEKFYFDLKSWYKANYEKQGDDTHLLDYNQAPLIEIKTQLLKLKVDKTALHKKDIFQSLLIDEIEEIWAAIDKEDNWQPFYTKLRNLDS